MDSVGCNLVNRVLDQPSERLYQVIHECLKEVVRNVGKAIVGVKAEAVDVLGNFFSKYRVPIIEKAVDRVGRVTVAESNAATVSGNKAIFCVKQLRIISKIEMPGSRFDSQ